MYQKYSLNLYMQTEKNFITTGIEWKINMGQSDQELKQRLEKDENMWLKIQEQANRNHAESLNQLADLFRIVQGLATKLEKQSKRLDVALGVEHKGDK